MVHWVDRCGRTKDEQETGVLAGRDCRSLVYGSSGIAGELSPLDSTPTGSVVCAYWLGLRRENLRDEGIVKVAGNALCVALNP
jgi:hypothetical protein